MLSGVIDRAKGMVWNGIIMIFKSSEKHVVDIIL